MYRNIGTLYNRKKWAMYGTNSVNIRIDNILFILYVLKTN